MRSVIAEEYEEAEVGPAAADTETAGVRGDGDVLAVQHVSKSYDRLTAVEDLSFSVKAGEFFSLLGPSGCGKTTTLKLISGLEHPDQGAIVLDGRDVASVPPNRRPVNSVFQNYALFPHMNVERNVGYSLRIRHISRATIRRRVGEMLELVGLRGLERRKPHELSGGQKQRVALARALINDPRILLLDEPLAALDLQLRLEMQTVLKELQRSVGVTFVYITHDQGEALSLSHRIGVMNHGVLQQIGSPETVYRFPENTFVARFIGKTSLLRAMKVRKDGEQVELQIAGTRVRGLWPPRVKDGREGEVIVSIRPEDVQVGPANGSAVRGTLARKSFFGTGAEATFILGDSQELTAWLPSRSVVAGLALGDDATLSWDAECCRVLESGAI